MYYLIINFRIFLLLLSVYDSKVYQLILCFLSILLEAPRGIERHVTDVTLKDWIKDPRVTNVIFSIKDVFNKSIILEVQEFKKSMY